MEILAQMIRESLCRTTLSQITHTQSFLGLHSSQTRMHQSPEAGVVKVIDVTVCLSPAKVVSEVLIGRIEDNAAIKGGWVLEGCGQEEG